jgi:hypothetical protein
MRLDSRPVHDMVFNMVLGDALNREKKPWAYLKALVKTRHYVFNEIGPIVKEDLQRRGFQQMGWM